MKNFDQLYFSDLNSLLTEVKSSEVKKDPQKKIADTGSDLKDAKVEKDDQLENEPIDTPNKGEDLSKDDNATETDGTEDEDLNDADYMNSDGMVDQTTLGLPTTEEPIEVSEKQRLLKIFNLLKNLLNYGELFSKSLEIIDTDLLDDEQLKQIQEYTKKIDRLNIKIRSYITDVFPTEKYEKALYVYILLNTELLTAVAALREVLGLNESDPIKK